MYCVIQEIQNKKAPYQPTSKKIEVTSHTWSIGNEKPYTHYGYSHSPEKFERPVRAAYKISIHKSYRENGKVEKKQTPICTMGYYDLLDSWPGDHLNTAVLNKKLEELSITEAELWDLIDLKLDPINKKVSKEFKKTEEYKVQQEQKKIIDKYQKNKKTFDSKYGERSYDRCYDVFGELRNKAYLEELKEVYETAEKYKRSYQDYNHSNHDWSKYSGYSGINSSTYTEEEKGLIEEIVSLGFKAVAKKYHPDINPNLKNATELFQRLNGVKEKLLKSI